MPSMNYLSPSLMVATLSLVCITLIGCLLFITTPTSVLCQLKYFIASIGFTGMLAVVVLKLYRFNRIFVNPDMRVVSITNAQLAIYLVLVVWYFEEGWYFKYSDVLL